MYDNIINLNNLYNAWTEFVKGKRYKKDVADFARYLDINIYNLHLDLKNKTYAHSQYKAFKINDPKPRDIHKASVYDRLLHHAIYRVLYPYFDRKFIHDSYSCRLSKGTHKAIQRFESFHRKVSRNNTRQCYVLKCDIRKFFASIDHNILNTILAKHIQDIGTLNLLSNIIDSFNTPCVRQDLTQKIGLPLGNLTSQLLVNIYMNEFDQYVKHDLKAKYYIRYADDFVFLSEDKDYLIYIQNQIQDFLQYNLELSLNPNKVYIKTIASGVDFLGWVHFPKHRVLRTATKKRMFRNLKNNNYKKESVNSYLGILKWGNTYKTKNKLNIR
jgi:retron-type reverse transcriptase